MRILPQATDHDYAEFQQWFEERSLGIGAVGDDPQPFSRGPGDLRGPGHQVRALLQLRLEFPTELFGQGRNVLASHIGAVARNKTRNSWSVMARRGSPGRRATPRKGLVLMTPCCTAQLKARWTYWMTLERVQGETHCGLDSSQMVR